MAILILCHNSTARLALFITVLVAFVSPALAQVGDVSPTHDPRIIYTGKYFYCFSTGIGIPIKRSEDLTHWQNAGVVFTALPSWITKQFPTARFIWAPDISFFAGTYHLYYAV